LTSSRPHGVFGDVLVNDLEVVSVSGVVIASINTQNDDWSTYRVRLTAANLMKVAPKHMTLADESGRLVLDDDPVITSTLTAIVSDLSQ